MVRARSLRAPATAGGTPASSAPIMSTMSIGAATSMVAVRGFRRSVSRASRKLSAMGQFKRTPGLGATSYARVRWWLDYKKGHRNPRGPGAPACVDLRGDDEPRLQLQANGVAGGYHDVAVGSLDRALRAHCPANNAA